MREASQHLNKSVMDEFDLAEQNQIVIGTDRVVNTNNTIANSIYSDFSSPDLNYDDKLKKLVEANDNRLKNVRNSVPLIGEKEAIKLDADSRVSLVKGHF